MRKFSEYVIAKDLEAANGSISKVTALLDSAKKYTVASDDLIDPVRAIQRKFNFPLRGKVVQELDDGEIIPLILPPEKAPHFPAFFPFITAGIGKSKISFVNLTRSSSMKEGHLEIEPRALYAYLQSGVIGRAFVEQWPAVSGSQKLLRCMSIIYSRCMMKVSDKLYGIGADQLSADQAAYAYAKFFLVYCMEKEPSASLEATAMRACPFKTSEATVRQVDSYIEDYADPEGFWQGLAGGVPRLRHVKRKAMVSEFATMYGVAALLAFEMPAYLVANLCAAQFGGGLNNEERFEMVAGDEGADLHSELARIIR